MIELDDRYFNRFSDTTVVELVPYDPALKVLAQRYIDRLRNTVGPAPEIEQRGATALHMVGKGEIDLYVRVKGSEFAEVLAALKAVLGPPGSLQPHRARFNDECDGIEVEVMLVEKDHPEERAGRRFFYYLQTHPEAVTAYAAVKRRYAPVSRREYYRQKYRFVCSILERASEGDQSQV